MTGSVLDDPLVTAAAAYAAAVHEGDTRKGGEVSYFDGHLAPVAAIVARDGGDAVQVAGAYLHDTAEDHGGQARLDDIADRFGDEVAAIVADLSDSLVDTEAGETKAPWRERKESYVDSMRTKPLRSLTVAAADKVHNATALRDDFAAVGDELWDRFTTGVAADQLWYYRSLADVITERLGDHPTARALAAAVDELTAMVRSH